jgi:hypothetical protein
MREDETNLSGDALQGDKVSVLLIRGGGEYMMVMVKQEVKSE